jgi:hypothetical protein
MKTNYAASTPAQKRMLVRRWKVFSVLSVEQENLDDTESGLKVGTYLDRVALFRDLDGAREAYVQSLVAIGVLGLEQELPDDNFLWENHPVNIEQELA